VTIGGSVRSLGSFASSSLKQVSIHEYNGIIPSYFLGGDHANKVTIGGSVTGIGANAFDGCELLREVDIPGFNGTVGDYAFSDCLSLTSFSGIRGMTSIGRRAFHRCSNLRGSFILPHFNGDIGEYAFYECENVDSFSVYGSVGTIGNSAFAECSQMTSFSVYGSVGTISSSVFSWCPKMNALTITGHVNLIEGGSSGNIIIGSVGTIKHFWFSNDETVAPSNFVVLGSVDTISASAFSLSNKLNSFTASGSVGSIGDSAFEYCYHLKEVRIPNYNGKIGSGLLVEAMNWRK